MRGDGPRRHPYLDHPAPIAFAHRGGGGENPENTMVAFEAAVRLGYRYVETDVHATADGALVAFHDAKLDRVTDRSGAIAQLSWAQVREARVSGSEPIPLLEDLLGTWPELRVNIDVKSDQAVAPLVAVLRRTGSVERVCIGSFSERRMRRLRAAVGDGLCTAATPAEVTRLRYGLGIPRGPAAAQVPVRQGPVTVVTPGVLARAHGAGIAVHVWTIDDSAEMERLFDLGADGIMTDRPTVLRDVLVRRGEWVT